MSTAIGGAGRWEPLLAVEDLRVEFAPRSALALLGLLPKRVGRITAGSVPRASS